MKKVLATLAIVMLMFSSMAFATNARVDGLGVPVWMIQDDSYVYTNPAALVQYPSMVVLEDGNLMQGNINMMLGDGVLGVFMTEGSPMVNSLINTASNNLTSPFITTDTYLQYVPYLTTIGYGMDLGGMAVGAAITIGMNSSGEEDNLGESDYTKDTTSAMNLGIKLGLSMTDGMPLDIAVSALLPMSDDTNEYIDNDGSGSTEWVEETKIDSGMVLDINARLGVESWMFGAGFNMASMTALRTETDTPALDEEQESKSEDSRMSIMLGASNTIMASDSLSVIVGGTFNYMSSTETETDADIDDDLEYVYKDEDSMISIPVYISAEGKLNDTWTVRGGVSRVLFNTNSEHSEDQGNAGDDDVTYDVTDTWTEDAETSMTLGATASIGDVKIEGDVEVDFATDGPYILSGESIGISGQIGIVYSWK